MHSILESPRRQRNIILTAISKLLFDLPIEHREHLEKLWVDQLVYSAAWRKHVSDRVGDLLQKMTWVSETLSQCGSLEANIFLQISALIMYASFLGT
jgi:hypothetical protein